MVRLACPRCFSIVHARRRRKPACPECGYGDPSRPPAGAEGKTVIDGRVIVDARSLPGLEAAEPRPMRLAASRAAAILLATASAVNIAYLYVAGVWEILTILVTSALNLTGLGILWIDRNRVGPRHKALLIASVVAMVVAHTLNPMVLAPFIESLSGLRMFLAVAAAHDLAIGLAILFGLWCLFGPLERGAVILGQLAGLGAAAYLFVTVAGFDPSLFLVVASAGSTAALGLIVLAATSLAVRGPEGVQQDEPGDAPAEGMDVVGAGVGVRPPASPA